MRDQAPQPIRPTLVREAQPDAHPFGPRGGARPPLRPPRRSRRLLPWALAAAGALLLLLPRVATRATDWLWFREIGFERVFVLQIGAQWTAGLATAAVAAAVLYLNARLAHRAALLATLEGPALAEERPRPRRAAQLELLRQAQPLLVLLLAVPLGLVAASAWRTIVQFQHRTAFGVADPVFGRDVGWYVFTLPMIELGLDLLLATLVLATVAIAGPIHLARGGLRLRRWQLAADRHAAVHLGALGAALLATVAAMILLLGVPSVLFASHAALQGASYTDLHVRIPALRATAALALVAAGVLAWSAWRRRFDLRTVVGLAACAGLGLLLVGPLPMLYQRLVVQPNELARETPQIAAHVLATRAAWGLDRVQERELGAAQGLTGADIAANRATIANVRLWDRAPLLQTFGQIQAIRTYYDFVSVDDDRYLVNGELRQVMLSARELNAAALPTRTFINEHLTFTHGMGVTLGPSNQVTSQGLPVLWVQDLPPASSIDVRVTRPQLYYGELSDDFVLAPSRQREFDYPAGEGDEAVYSRYAGAGGVPINTLARRLLFAIRFGSLNVLLTRDLQPDTRVLFHRDVASRARLALPFLRFDADPYLVVTDAGHLVWMLDAYTATDRYPYAQPLADGTRYMRNAVKVTVDAYDGTVRAYVADPADPMVRTLGSIYPRALRPLAEMPADLRRHVRYPQDLFQVQTALYATFHMTEPETFYHREDQWAVPAAGGGEDDEGFMRHIVMRLPGEPSPEFILMRPFTPRQKDNLAAWMVARNDGERYGELVAYRFPRQSLVFGPAQVVNRINQDTEVARQVSLWDQRGSEVIRGELLVIPIEGSLIYVQPLYLRAEGGRIPELKRVIVVHESRVAMEETLEAGLARLFDASAADLATDAAGAPARTAEARPAADPATGAAAAGADPATAELLRQAVQHYDRARAAQRADDWATYGDEMRRLGEVLSRLRGGQAP